MPKKLTLDITRIHPTAMGGKCADVFIWDTNLTMVDKIGTGLAIHDW